MARTLIGNFMGPEGPRGLQGEQGPRGPQGEQGEQGEVGNVKTNIVPFNTSKWENGGLFSGSGGPSDSTNHLRTKDYIDVVKGETYTLSDESKYISSVSAIWVHEYENGSYTDDYFFINRGAETTFTTNGNQIKIVLRAMDGFTIQPHFVESPDERIKLKIEMGEKTPNLSALNDITRSIDKVNDFDDFYVFENLTGSIPYSSTYSAKNNMTILGSPDGWNSSTQELTLPGPGNYQIMVHLSPNTFSEGVVEVDIRNGDTVLSSVRGETNRTTTVFASVSTISAIPRINVAVAHGVSGETFSLRGSNSNKFYIKKLPN